MKQLLTSVLILFTITMSSQIITCGVDQQEILDHFSNNSNNNLLPNTVYDATTKYVFNVRFHVVYNDDGVTRTNSLGQQGLVIGENEVLNAIRDLNIAFNQFNIFFKYYGFDNINETDYLILETIEELVALRNHSIAIPNAINLFICNGGIVGADARNNFFNDDAFIRPWTLNHELGHIFSLVHTWYMSSTGMCQHDEHAERIVGMPNFNAKF